MWNKFSGNSSNSKMIINLQDRTVRIVVCVKSVHETRDFTSSMRLHIHINEYC
jgi:hypothetical protein